MSIGNLVGSIAKVLFVTTVGVAGLDSIAEGVGSIAGGTVDATTGMLEGGEHLTGAAGFFYDTSVAAEQFAGAVAQPLAPALNAFQIDKLANPGLLDNVGSTAPHFDTADLTNGAGAIGAVFGNTPALIEGTGPFIANALEPGNRGIVLAGVGTGMLLDHNTVINQSVGSTMSATQGLFRSTRDGVTTVSQGLGRMAGAAREGMTKITDPHHQGMVAARQQGAMVGAGA